MWSDVKQHSGKATRHEMITSQALCSVLCLCWIFSPCTASVEETLICTERTNCFVYFSLFFFHFPASPRLLRPQIISTFFTTSTAKKTHKSRLSLTIWSGALLNLLYFTSRHFPKLDSLFISQVCLATQLWGGFFKKGSFALEGITF